MEYTRFDPALLTPDQLDTSVRDMNRLLSQLTEKPQKITQERLENFCTRSHLFIARESTLNTPDGLKSYTTHVLYGIASLVPAYTLLCKSGRVESVVVDKDRRGQGHSRHLMDALIAFARQEGMDELELTSRPSREVANTLYPKLGFERRDTNVYRLTF